MQSDEVRKKIEARLQAAEEKPGFDHTCGMLVLDWGEGKARVEIQALPAVSNPVGNLHGGAIATLVDVAGTVAIMSADREGRSGVTTDLTTSYFLPVPAGATVLGRAEVLKIGKSLAFVTVDVLAEDGRLVAQGRMTKYMA